MRFFTPELYARFNSPDDGVADDADEAWERALNEYRDHLNAIRDRMTSPVRKLADLCLHDAELLAFDEVIEPAFSFPYEPFGPYPHWSAMVIISLKQDGRIVTLIYLVWDRVREHPAPQDWPFSKARTHWLYDEIDAAEGRRGMFTHRILFSDGRVLDVPFTSVIVHGLPLVPPTENVKTRQSA